VLVRTSRVVAGVAPTAAVVVVGGDAIVGRALALLLRGSGYDARFEALPTFDARRALRDVGLILLAPGLDERGRGAILSSIEAACHEGDLPVLELVPATVSRFGKRHALVFWPCRTEDLEREIEAALSSGRSRAGLVGPPVAEGRRTAYDHGHRPHR
jgi:hypothetical protein